MSSSDSSRYAAQAIIRAGVALPAFGFATVTASVAFNAGQILLVKNPDDATTEEIPGIVTQMEQLVSDKKIENCHIQVPTHATDPSVYIECLKADTLNPGLVPMLVMGFLAARVGFGMIGKTAAYFNLAKNGKASESYYVPDLMSADDLQEFDEEGEDFKIIPAEPKKTAPAFDSETSFTIMNGVNPFASIEMKPDDVVFAEKGALLARTDKIEMETKISMSVGRLMSGEGMTMLKFTNISDEPQSLLLAPANDGEIVEIDLSKEHHIVCDNGAFFASVNEVEIGVTKTGNISMRTFSGMGRVLQTISEVDGVPSRVLLSSHGQVFKKELGEGESMQVQGSHVLAMSHTVIPELTEIKGTFTRVAGGEGPFLLSLLGPGNVWLSSGGEAKQTGLMSSINRMLEGIIPG